MKLVEIEEKCEKLRKKHNIIIPVNDCYELANQIGGHIVESDKLPEDTIGNIRRQGDSFLITLNSKLSDDEKKIAVAQLIGVICLYTPYLDDEGKWRGYPEFDIDVTKDMLANGMYFAKELLLPKYLFLSYFCQNITIAHKINLTTLSKIFNVPVGLIRERGIDLNMIVVNKPDLNQILE